MGAAAPAPADSIMARVSSASAREVLAFTITEAPPDASERAPARPPASAAPAARGARGRLCPGVRFRASCQRCFPLGTSLDGNSGAQRFREAASMLDKPLHG